MSSATLSEIPATQLTFPWVLPRDCDVVEVADRVHDQPRRTPRTRSHARGLPDCRLSAQTVAKQASSSAMRGTHDRLGKTFHVGSVMFRLLKSYGITDEEIAEGIASYVAKHS